MSDDFMKILSNFMPLAQDGLKAHKLYQEAKNQNPQELLKQINQLSLQDFNGLKNSIQDLFSYGNPDAFHHSLPIITHQLDTLLHTAKTKQQKNEIEQFRQELLDQHSHHFSQEQLDLLSNVEEKHQSLQENTQSIIQSHQNDWDEIERKHKQLQAEMAKTHTDFK